jgi:hypothetical protein
MNEREQTGLRIQLRRARVAGMSDFGVARRGGGGL